MNLIATLSSPIIEDLIFYFSTEFFFSFYIPFREKLFEELLIQCSFFEFCNLSYGKLKSFLFVFFAVLVQSQISGYIIPLFFFKSLTNSNLYAITSFLTHQLFLCGCGKIFYEERVVFLQTTFHFVTCCVGFNKTNIYYSVFTRNRFFIPHITVTILQSFHFLINHFVGNINIVGCNIGFCQICQFKFGF